MESLRPGHAIKLGLDPESSASPRNVVLTSQELSGRHQWGNLGPLHSPKEDEVTHLIRPSFPKKQMT